MVIHEASSSGYIEEPPIFPNYLPCQLRQTAAAASSQLAFDSLHMDSCKETSHRPFAFEEVSSSGLVDAPLEFTKPLSVISVRSHREQKSSDLCKGNSFLI